MRIFVLIIGLAFLAIVMLDAYQTIILPRRPVRRLRITSVFFAATWRPWRFAARWFRTSRAREQFFSSYGPVALLLLIAVWAVMLIGSFGLVFFGLGTPLSGTLHTATAFAQLRSCLYASGTTLFTLGLGDVLPTTHLGRFVVVTEAGVGLAYVALVIGYVPVLYTTFSHREVTVALLDARAGSPPTSGELIVRHNFNGGHHALTAVLAEWERWSAEMLETHISYPILCYYRSQHDNQSWLSAVTAILDTCALLITAIEGPSTRQAQLTFAMARHMLVDFGHVFRLEPVEQRFPLGESRSVCVGRSSAGYATRSARRDSHSAPTWPHGSGSMRYASFMSRMPAHWQSIFTSIFRYGCRYRLTRRRGRTPGRPSLVCACLHL